METENGIGSYYNRAAARAQAFVKEFGPNPQGETLDKVRTGRANGMEKVIPNFAANAPHLGGVTYHLMDAQSGTAPPRHRPKQLPKTTF